MPTHEQVGALLMFCAPDQNVDQAMTAPPPQRKERRREGGTDYQSWKKKMRVIPFTTTTTTITINTTIPASILSSHLEASGAVVILSCSKPERTFWMEFMGHWQGETRFTSQQSACMTPTSTSNLILREIPTIRRSRKRQTGLHSLGKGKTQIESVREQKRNWLSRCK